MQIALLGATGSIGRSCQDVVRSFPEQMRFHAVSAHRDWKALAKICQEFQPDIAVISDQSLRSEVNFAEFPSCTQVTFGPDHLENVAQSDQVATVVAGIVGAAGLGSSFAAVRAGKRLAIANKETMVVAGPLMVEAAQKSGAELLPVDSEHSAIYQALLAGSKGDVDRVILTSSGGPFRTWDKEQIAEATVEQALNHPTWKMGPKVTIDSATLMNKALEVIEARWLFDLNVQQLDVVIHPQSIVHSMVEYRDGSVIAQMSPPDMRLPIQYALTYPQRFESVATRMDFQKAFQLDFFPPDLERFPALELGFRVAEWGGTSGAVLNAASEIAVERFLREDLSFPEISIACREILEKHPYQPQPEIDDCLACDQWARKEMSEWKSSRLG